MTQELGAYTSLVEDPSSVPRATQLKLHVSPDPGNLMPQTSKAPGLPCAHPTITHYFVCFCFIGWLMSGSMFGCLVGLVWFGFSKTGSHCVALEAWN